MALINCHECDQQISDQAPVCPHCGAPKKQTVSNGPANTGLTLKDVMGVIFWICLVVVALGSCSEKEGDISSGSSSTSKCATGDLECLGNAGTVSAGLRCAPEVEKLAKNSMRWTDGTFEPKFSHFRWHNKELGTVTFIGDKAEFQNGFGAHARVIYECDLSPDYTQVLDVRARQGRLP